MKFWKGKTKHYFNKSKERTVVRDHTLVESHANEIMKKRKREKREDHSRLDRNRLFFFYFLFFSFHRNRIPYFFMKDEKKTFLFHMRWSNKDAIDLTCRKREREAKNKTIKWVNFFSNFKRYKHLQYFTVSSCYNYYPICVYRFRLIVRSKSVSNTHNLLFVAAWPIWLILKKILSRFNIRGTHTHFFVLFQSFTT